VDILLYSKDDDAKTMIRDEGFDEVFDCKGNMLAPGFIDIQREYCIKSPYYFLSGTG
jgi:N-acetylglucosamine-6-phosphate deacetylase